MSRMMFRVGSVSSSSTDDDEVHNLRPPCPRSSVWQPQTPQNTRRLRQRDELAPLVLLSVSGQRVGQGQEGQPGGQRQRGSSLFSSSRIPLSKSISTDKSCKTKEDKSVKIPKLKKTSTNESGRSPRSESLTVYGNAVPPTMKNSLAMPLGYYSLGRNAPKPQPINGMDASLDSSASGRTSDFLVGGYQRPSKAASVHSSREHQGQTRPVPVIRLPQHRISSSEEEKTETEQKKSASDFDLHHMARKTFDRGIVTSSSLKADQRSRVRTLSNIPSSSSQSGNPTDSSSKQRYRNPAKLFSKKSKINGSCKNDDIKKSLDTKEMRGKAESDSGKDWRQARDWYSFDDDDDSRSGSFSSKSVNCGVFAGSSRGGMDGWRYRSEGGSGPVKSFSGRQTSKSSSFWESLSGYADCEDSTDDESSLNAPQKNKIRKLKRELDSAQEKIHTLTTQLTTNAHVVAAFEQSLSSMTQRLQKLTASSQQKDQELNELRRTVAAMSHPGRSGESSINKSSQRNSSSSGSSVSKSSAGNSCTAANGGSSTAAVPLDRHMSADSVSSLNSFSSALSQLSSAAGRQQQQMTHPVTAVVSSADSTSSSGDKKKVKKSWLRTSFSKAFSRKKSSRQCSLSDVEGDTVSLRSVPNSPMLHLSHTVSMPTTPIKGLNAHLSAVCVGGLDDSAVLQLRQELHEKDLKLTDIQLDALTSAHQLEQMCDMMNRLKSEMSSLKADNDRLQRIIAQKDLTHQLNSNSSHISSAAGPLDQTDSTEGSAADGRNDPEAIEVDVEDGSNDGLEKRKLYVKVKLNPQSISSSSSSASSSPSSSAAVREKKISDIVIGVISITSTTKWETLDSQVRRKFKEYISWIDSGSGLTGSSSSNCSGGTGMGLTTDGIARYEIASVSRSKGVKAPDALPWLLTDTEDQREISLTLKGSKEGCIDSLSFESLIPRSIVQRYVSLLQEHHRIILSGPSGTGKTFLAFKLAEHIVCLSGREGEVGAVATFNVDHKSGKELRQYLSNIAEQCGNP